jgi:putative endonuclease
VPWVYILRCADDSFHVGSTRDLEFRLQQHAIGRVDAFTKSRRPVALAWAQECEHIEDAYMLEHKIKGWRREKKLALIKGSYSDLPRLSRSGSHKPRSAQVPSPGVLLRPSSGTVLSPSTSSGHMPQAQGTSILAYCAYGANGAKCFTKWPAMMR